MIDFYLIKKLYNFTTNQCTNKTMTSAARIGHFNIKSMKNL